MALNVKIQIRTQKTAVQKLEQTEKQDAARRIYAAYKNLDDNSKKRINFDDVNDAIQKIATFDFSQLENEILGVKNGKLGRLTADKKYRIEIAMMYKIKYIEDDIIEKINAAQSEPVETVESESVDEIEIEKQITAERIQTRKEQIAEIDSKIAELIREKAELEAKLADDQNHLNSLNDGAKLEEKLDSKTVEIEQKNDGNSTADKRTTLTTSSTPADNNPAAMVILNNPNENLSKVFRIDTDEQRQKCINALYDYLEIFLIDTFDDETFEPAGIGLDPTEIVTSIEMMIEDHDPEYLNELLQSNGISLQIR